MSIFQQYYDLEKNFVISCFWDSGFTVRFGDTVNGYTERNDCDTWEEVEEIFRRKLEAEKK